MLPSVSGVAVPQVGAPMPQSGENLFEHIAGQLQGQVSGLDPAHMGSAMLQGMDGFLRRSSSMNGYMSQFTKGFTSRPDESSFRFVSKKSAGGSASGAQGSGAQAGGAVSADDRSRLTEWLIKSFNFSIESGVVAGSTSKMTNSINTLLKGQ